MSRMHSSAKGQSGSKRPAKKTIPSWVRYKGNEVELLVGKLGKEGMSAAQIGMVLRDSYGIPDVKTLSGKSVSVILSEKNLLPEVPEDLRNLISRAAMIRKHLEENKHDMPAKRGLQLTESKIGRLVKYYKGVSKLSAEWKYDPSKASTYLE